MFDFRKLRICFLAAQLGHGGAERQLYFVLKVLKQKGTTPYLLSKTKGQYWEKRISNLGVPVKYVGRHTSKFLRLFAILKEVHKFKPDVVQSQHFHMNSYAAATARLLRLRDIGASRNDVTSEIQVTGRVLGNISLRAPRIVAANSKKAICNAIALGIPSDRLFFLPNVVDIDYYEQIRGQRENDTVQIIGVGSLWKPKRFDRFLTTIALLRKHTNKVFRVVIIGDGPLRMQLEKQAADLGLLPDVVEFTGDLPDVMPVYRESDILMLTSDHEGTPNVVLEAMASGLPVVATNVGGVPEIIQHGKTGYLADPKDESMMVEILLALVNDPNLRGEIGNRARQYVEKHHSLVQLTHNLEKLYEKVFS